MNQRNVDAPCDAARATRFTCLDEQVEISGVIPEGGWPYIQVRAFRRAPEAVGPEDFHAQGAGVRLPLALIESVSEGLVDAKARVLALVLADGG